MPSADAGPIYAMYPARGASFEPCSSKDLFSGTGKGCHAPGDAQYFPAAHGNTGFTANRWMVPMTREELFTIKHEPLWRAQFPASCPLWCSLLRYPHLSLTPSVPMTRGYHQILKITWERRIPQGWGIPRPCKHPRPCPWACPEVLPRQGKHGRAGRTLPDRERDSFWDA